MGLTVQRTFLETTSRERIQCVPLLAVRCTNWEKYFVNKTSENIEFSFNSLR